MLSGADTGVSPQIEFATCGKLLFGPLARHKGGLLHPVPQGNHPVRHLDYGRGFLALPRLMAGPRARSYTARVRMLISEVSV